VFLDLYRLEWSRGYARPNRVPKAGVQQSQRMVWNLVTLTHCEPRIRAGKERSYGEEDPDHSIHCSGKRINDHGTERARNRFEPLFTDQDVLYGVPPPDKIPPTDNERMRAGVRTRSSPSGVNWAYLRCRRSYRLGAKAVQ